MRHLRIAFSILILIFTSNAYCYDSAEEIRKSAKEIDHLIEVSSSLDTEHKMRVIMDVSGGIPKLLKQTYNGLPENDYQLAYSFALIHLATLAESMGLPKAASCHKQESIFLFEASKLDNDDLSSMPKCRQEIYTTSVRSEAVILMTSDPQKDAKYNELAGSLIKQISINSYFTTKLLRTPTTK